MVIVFFAIFLISFILALWSMSDFNLPKEIFRLIDQKRIKGTIIFLKNKIIHYSISSSSKSSFNEESKGR